MDDCLLHADNPLRPVDWRHQLAVQLDQTGAAPAVTHDDATRALWTYLQARRRCHSCRDHGDLAQRFSGLHEAVQFADQASPDLRAALEAWLLTGGSASHIASQIGISVPAVQWFAAVFFDLAGRRNATAFILFDVIGHAGSADDGGWRHRLWKFVAYVAGGEALNELLGIGEVNDLEALSSRLSQRMRLHMLYRLAQMADSIPLEKMERLLRLNDSNAEGGESAAGRVYEQFLEHMKKVFAMNPFRVGQEPRDDEIVSAERRRIDAYLKNLADKGIEPNYRELLIIEAGYVLPNEDALLKVRFPESGEK